MPSPSPGLTTLLTGLAAAGIEFVLVGALAAVAQGAPITTHDVDIVHRRTAANVDALLQFLDSVGARYRRRDVVLPPSRAALLGVGHNLLATDLGPLDVLGAIERGLDYDQLLPESLVVTVGGHRVHVLALAKLAELKRGSTQAKDKLTLAILEETLRRQTTSS